ncbi:hypothetical protein AMTR_s00089p00126830 [Amborella trichopoda]|uniref:Uncharacterized protein n=1 Tax=Amborella trichopoda TaxID=13333 RepID=W1P4J6_AMBTC|nr:hypothetical protein AMTR_s00089p00126830 [Amborella trichopoda]
MFQQLLTLCQGGGCPYSLWTVSEAYQRALTVEKQQSRGRASIATRGDLDIRIGQFQDRGGRLEDASSGGCKDVIAAPIHRHNTAGLGSRGQGSSSTLYCFK